MNQLRDIDTIEKLFAFITEKGTYKYGKFGEVTGMVYVFPRGLDAISLLPGGTC